MAEFITQCLHCVFLILYDFTKTRALLMLIPKAIKRHKKGKVRWGKERGMREEERGPERERERDEAEGLRERERDEAERERV